MNNLSIYLVTVSKQLKSAHMLNRQEQNLVVNNNVNNTDGSELQQLLQTKPFRPNNVSTLKLSKLSAYCSTVTTFTAEHPKTKQINLFFFFLIKTKQINLRRQKASH